MFCLRSDMRFDRDQLIFKALCALDEAIDECRATPIRPSFALRFSLAFLFALSDGCREPYDAFWREVTDPKTASHSVEAGQYVRTTYARTAMTAIARGVGVELTVDVMQSLSTARRLRSQK
jgi:hypothetical protein